MLESLGAIPRLERGIEHMPYSNVLQVNWNAKSIPYSGVGEIRPDGDANYGFKYLKGRPSALDEIPELGRDSDLRELVAAINAPSTGLFSVGCVSAPVDEDRGYRMCGYVEFAFNSAAAAADARQYFPVFFHFDRVLREEAFAEEVHFHWELMGANFVDAEVTGFSAAITINTGFHVTLEEARRAWARALEQLAIYLASVPPMPGRAIVPDE